MEKEKTNPLSEEASAAAAGGEESGAGIVYVRCPICGSENIEANMDHSVYRCLDCGHIW